MRESNFIVLVTCPDLESLTELAATAVERGIRVSLNYEPDVGDELTAVVMEPGEASRKLCGSLPLMGGVPVR